MTARRPQRKANYFGRTTLTPLEEDRRPVVVNGANLASHALEEGIDPPFLGRHSRKRGAQRLVAKRFAARLQCLRDAIRQKKESVVWAELHFNGVVRDFGADTEG